jgi:hypothetical protein
MMSKGDGCGYYLAQTKHGEFGIPRSQHLGQSIKWDNETIVASHTRFDSQMKTFEGSCWEETTFLHAA